MKALLGRGAGTGLLLAALGFASLSVGDAVVKSMAGEWPAPAVSALRYTMGALGLSAILALRQGRAAFTVPRPWLQLGRAAAVSVSTICFFLGVMAMPLADATSIQFTSPILTAILSGIVLRERVPKAAWLAILLAFAGVLIVLRPNVTEFGAAAFYPLGAAFGMAWLIILNRKAAGDAPALVMQWLLAVPAVPILIASAALLSASGAEGLRIGWPSLEVVVKCAIVAVTATTGHLLLYAGTVRASAAAVSPMTYTQLFVATALGWVWFGDAPDLATYAGAALIIAGGLWLWRSQREWSEAAG